MSLPRGPREAARDAAGRSTTQDTLGEFVLRTWLANGGAVTPPVAETAAAGWGGDRIALVRNGDRSGIVIDTRWDTVADAAGVRRRGRIDPRSS